ncbi:MAG: MBL fold metallo-hydrolase [Thermoplasmata archaeon]|nr:MBL fold metallo-hydrolase [Thermoplasmata archaeon]
MVVEVLPGIFRIEVPLPKNPLRSVNSYVILGDDRNLIIDTGMNREECREVLDKGLAEIGLDLSRTDIFLTHYHADHMGLAPHVATPNSKVFMSREDSAVISEKEYWRDMLKYALLNGFPPVDPQEAIRKHPGYRYGPLERMNITHLKDGGRLKVGRYNLKVVITPGHTVGHSCLYEPGEKLLFSGDHILGDITPNISLWSEKGDPLGDYLESLDRVAEMEIGLTLPGHRTRIRNAGKRIAELKEHHKERAREIEVLLEEGEMNGFTVASRMTWDMTYDSFDDFPIMQKWFALGEAIAHLRYLEVGKRVFSKTVSGQILYHL